MINASELTIKVMMGLSAIDVLLLMINHYECVRPVVLRWAWNQLTLSVHIPEGQIIE